MRSAPQSGPQVQPQQAFEAAKGGQSLSSGASGSAAQVTPATQATQGASAVQTNPTIHTIQASQNPQAGVSSSQSQANPLGSMVSSTAISQLQHGQTVPPTNQTDRRGGDSSGGGGGGGGGGQERQAGGGTHSGQEGHNPQRPREQVLPSEPEQGASNGSSSDTAESKERAGASKPHSVVTNLGAKLDSIAPTAASAPQENASEINLLIDSHAALQRVARGLDKASYDRMTVSAVVSALSADLEKVADRIEVLKLEAEQGVAELFGPNGLMAVEEGERAVLMGVLARGEMPGDKLVDSLSDAARAQIAQPQVQRAMADTSLALAHLHQTRDLHSALEKVIERPETLVPTMPVYSLEAERLAQVEWAAGGKAEGSIVFSRVHNGDLQRVRLDVARTVEGTVVVGRLEGNALRALDVRGRATHEFTRVAHGLWDEAQRVSARADRQEADFRGLISRAQISLKDGAAGLARITFEQVLKAEPNHLPALMGYARALMAQGDTEGALQHAARAARIAPAEPGALHVHALALKQSGRQEEARAAFALAQDALAERMSGPLFGNPVFWDRDDMVLRGEVLLQLGQHQEALAMLERVVAESPNDAAAREKLGDVLLSQGSGEEARRQFARAHELKPQSGEALLGVARAERMMGREEESGWSYIHAAQVSFEKGQYHRSIAIYREFLDAKPNNAHALTGLGFALDRLDRATEAADAFTRAGEASRAALRWQDALRNFDYALERAPRHVAAEIGRGKVLLSLRDLPGARESFERVLNLEPDNIDALIGRGEVCLALWDYANAADFFDRVLEVDPTNLHALLSSARAYLSAGEPTLAVYSIEIAQQFAPESIEVQLVRAQCNLKLDRLQEALTGFEDVLNRSPDHEEAQVGRLSVLSRMPAKSSSADESLEVASAFASQGRHAEACSHYERAASLAAERPAVWLGLGRARAALGQFDVARQAFLAALKLAPDDLVAMMGAARASMAIGEHETAQALYEAVRQASPMDLEAALGSGNTLLASRRFEEALDSFASALQIDGHNLEAFLGKAEAHLAVGETDAAQRSFAYALGIEPGNARAIAGSQQIVRLMSASSNRLRA